MDKNTLSHYGWIVVLILILSVLLALATPFGLFVARGFEATYVAFTMGDYEGLGNLIDEAGGNEHTAVIIPPPEVDGGETEPGTGIDIERFYKMLPVRLGKADMYGEAFINSNGEIDYDEVLANVFYDCFPADDFTAETVAVGEDEMLNIIRNKFIFSDEQFENFKAQGTYMFSSSYDYVKYQDGVFTLTDPRRGDAPDFKHDLKGFVDDKAGTLKLYYDYSTTGYNDGTESTHQYYYEVVYKYSGSTNFDTLYNEGMGMYYIIGTDENVINSLRAETISKVATLPVDMTPAE